MLTSLSEKAGRLHFLPDQNFGLSEIPGMKYWIHETDEIKIEWGSWKRDEYQAELINYRSIRDDTIIFSDLPFPYTLAFIFGYSIRLFLVPNLYREMHDRGGELFYSPELNCKIRFQKDHVYLLIFIHYPKNFIITNLEENARKIRKFWQDQSPVFYYTRSRIITRDTMELLAILLYSRNISPDNYILKDEAARALLLEFLNETGASFQPSHLRTADLNLFYPEKDSIAKLATTRGSTSKLLKKSEIQNVNLFRKRIKQLYNLNISEFITETRMATALELLRDQTLSIKEIAYKTGFPNSSYFSRVFTQYFGCSPRFFRSGFGL